MWFNSFPPPPPAEILSSSRTLCSSINTPLSQQSSFLSFLTTNQTFHIFYQYQTTSQTWKIKPHSNTQQLKNKKNVRLGWIPICLHPQGISTPQLLPLRAHRSLPPMFRCQGHQKHLDTKRSVRPMPGGYEGCGWEECCTGQTLGT